MDSSPVQGFGRLLAVCAGRQKGGPKRSVGQAQLARGFGLSGDADAGPGGRQLALLDPAALDPGQAPGPGSSWGSLGENLVIEGLDLRALPPGTRLRIGDALVELTGPEPGGPLVTARVRLAGIVTAGDQVAVESRPR
jgi:hypothetical protein